jgi:hypothetical protein
MADSTADEREQDLARTPDQRMQYGETRRKQMEGAGDRSGPSPYDLASEDMPDDRVIEKGEHEKPGPTATRRGPTAEERSASAAQQDEMLEENRINRGDGATSGSGGMSGSLEDEEALEAAEETGSLGGDGLHRRINDYAGDDARVEDPDDAA